MGRRHPRGGAPGDGRGDRAQRRGRRGLRRPLELSRPGAQTVGVWFWGRVAGGSLQAGDDLDRLDYFPLTAPPPLAFPTDATVIADLARGRA
jgi:hypothetical protein